MFSRLRRRDGRHGEPVTFAAGAGLVSARLRDEHGSPLSGGEMVLRHKRSQRVTRAVSDDFGLAVVTAATGTYEVAVSSGGYREVRHTVDVASGDHTSLGDIELQPDATVRLPDPGRWVIDPDHTSIRFVARHIGLSRVHGRFTRFHGSIHVGERIENSRIEVVIDAASIDTAAEKRDEHLRSPDFLDVERFPKIHFFSDRARRAAGDRWHIDGTLNLRGASRGVRLDASYLGLRSWNGDRLGAVAKTELHREDFTINWQQTLAKGLVVVGSTIELRLDVQAVRDA
ncbi:YceI family protein [Amycolatopsis thermophila]|uniref:Polyisoprenoid-binding protein YceI n=1 Tax=Amycolatopsis thermophila TaxID=206084 RepID=A0ABU0ESA3_9PSEU|nr:YceI family protein [Amycolatopsis thermophila]MDQ0378184.1 polyisoprenoid-binding protein YceI [Amycolatopsis thermophila]